MTDSAPRNHHYKAAVFDRKTIGKLDERNDAMAVVRMNLSRYEETAEKAAKEDGAQIIVFPEIGLFPWRNCLPMVRPFAQSVGNPGDDLTTKLDDSFSIVRGLAMIAKNCSIVVVANICEKTNNDKLYNTEVAIAETGKLLAKYHKMHPALITTIDTPATKEVVTFETSFGVTFGLFTCKDLLHAEPQRSIIKELGVTQIAYSVAFVDNWLSRWYASSWARKNKATFLASNLGGGSGIFAGGDGGADVVKRDGYKIATIYV